MNLSRIKQRLLGGGFRPFAVRTSDGRQYSVRHPELILIGQHSLGVLDEDGEIVTIDPLHIVAVKDLSRRKNGSSKH